MSTLPVPAASANGEAGPYLDGLTAGRLMLPRCEACAAVIWYPREFCPRCGTDRVAWFEASGTGHVYSFTVVRKPVGGYAAAGPYVVAYVELDEGPRVLTNVVGDPSAVHIGARVAAALGDSVDLLRFRLDEGGA